MMDNETKAKLRALCSVSGLSEDEILADLIDAAHARLRAAYVPASGAKIKDAGR